MMSFSAQRPNFVLVWIGIVLLTFSFISNFLAGRGIAKVSPSEGSVGPVGVNQYDDSLPLPNLSNASVVIIEESGFRIGSDPLTMGSHELQGNSYPPLADQGQADLTSNGERLPSEFPLELREDAQEGQQGQPAVVKGMEILPTDESSRPNHALRPAVSNRSQPISSTVASSSRLDPDYGASRRHLSYAADKAKRNLDRPDFGAKVKARILGSRPGGTVVVSLV
ncbi:MAG: hypothetical protein QF489_05800, partial [Planctomycetota bacterium]|nr:hypothetical protein [Planctomycetota bacterium]